MIIGRVAHPSPSEESQKSWCPILRAVGGWPIHKTRRVASSDPECQGAPYLDSEMWAFVRKARTGWWPTLPLPNQSQNAGAPSFGGWAVHIV